MRLTRIYYPGSLAAGDSLELGKDTLHYLRNVLRLQKGQELLLFNERDGEFSAEIAAVSKSSLEVSLRSRQREAQIPGFNLSLGLALSKGDRMDYGIQKSAELGVNNITPLRCEHSEAKLKPDRLQNRMAHWRRIGVSAAEQSDRFDVPVINEPLPFTEWIERPGDHARLLFDPLGEESLPDALERDAIAVTIGPEGGFSPAELDAAKQNGFRVCRLGPRVLRTETAPVVALAILQHRYGDMK